MYVYMRFEIRLVCWSVGPSDEVLSTAYPPLIHPINRVWSVGFDEQIKELCAAHLQQNRTRK